MRNTHKKWVVIQANKINRTLDQIFYFKKAKEAITFAKHIGNKSIFWINPDTDHYEEMKIGLDKYHALVL